ncbi:MAG: lysoplasmalogenase, partial [Actinomycetota bacterium]|nr:lysoplasmalogenase [Actinomycetota bacterium]
MAALAAADWRAVWRRDRRAEYVFKPLTTVALILTAASFRSDAPAHLWSFVVAALLFSLLGDVFLMLERYLFVPGLAAFLAAHVCYIVAFQPSAPASEPLVAVT